MFDFVEKMGIAKQGLSRNAAPVQTDPPEFRAFNARHGFAVVGGMDGSFVTSGTRPDNDNIKDLTHHSRAPLLRLKTNGKLYAKTLQEQNGQKKVQDTNLMKEYEHEPTCRFRGVPSFF